MTKYKSRVRYGGFKTKSCVIFVTLRNPLINTTSVTPHQSPIQNKTPDLISFTHSYRLSQFT